MACLEGMKPPIHRGRSPKFLPDNGEEAAARRLWQTQKALYKAEGMLTETVHEKAAKDIRRSFARYKDKATSTIKDRLQRRIDSGF